MSGAQVPTLLRVSSQAPSILKEDSGCDEVVGESRELLGSMDSPELAGEVVRRWNAHERLVRALQDCVMVMGRDLEGLKLIQPELQQAREALGAVGRSVE